MFFDSHSHLQLIKEFPDFEAAMGRAEKADVKGQLVIGFNMDVSQQAIDFANKFEDRNIWAAIGIHPHDAAECSEENLHRLKKMAENKRVKAIGEIGLDYFRNLQPKEMQIRVFKEQLQLAKELDLPAVLHVRDAWDEVMEMLKDEPYNKIILHSFTGNFSQAKEGWERGYYLSFSAMVTYPKNDALREIATVVPLDKILIETDCPYLPPQKFRGQRNEPAYVVEVARELATVNKMTVEEMGEITTRNAMKCFNLG